MLQTLSNVFAMDGHAGQALIGVFLALVVAGLAYLVYRVGFAGRIRAPGATRGRAPRLGVVDVFGLDGQRQLVIVRRDNIEHLLMIGGPNDIVIESQILRNAGNGREAAKAAGAAEPAAEAVVPPAPAPRPVAPPAPAAPPPPRRAPLAVEPAAPAPVVAINRVERVSAAPAVAPEPAPRAAPKAEILPPRAPPEPPPPPAPKLAEAEAEPPPPKPALELAQRKPVPAKPAPAPARPHLPAPITPLRPRATAETAAPEAARLAPSPAQAPAKPGKDDAFYDLESLEAEMARLLGRDG